MKRRDPYSAERRERVRLARAVRAALSVYIYREELLAAKQRGVHEGAGEHFGFYRERVAATTPKDAYDALGRARQLLAALGSRVDRGIF
jgi:hypothetical protein